MLKEDNSNIKLGRAIILAYHTSSYNVTWTIANKVSLFKIILKEDNSKRKKGRAIVLVHNALSWPAAYAY